MTVQPPEQLTLAAARDLQHGLAVTVAEGLSEAELNAVEQRFGFRFAADHRTFLRAGLPLGEGWPDWRAGDPGELGRRLAAPVEGVLFDVGHYAFWHPAWGERPAGSDVALRIASERLREVPQLVPVFGHRYLPGIAGQWGHPVKSVHQTDIIYYGVDLADYLHCEFGGPTRDRTEARASVDFWSYLLGETGTPRPATLDTPHNPYAVTADEAVEHLRMLALERLIGRHVSAAQLVQAGLVALVLDVEAPSLALLAGLTRREELRAGELFEDVTGELGLTTGLPEDEADQRWILVRWWLQLIVNGSLHPATGGDLIWYEGWAELGYPEALRPVFDATVQYDEWTPDWPMPREELSAANIQAARPLTSGSWPPGSG